MPSARARTSAVRTACTRPGSVMTLVTGGARIVTIPTSGGGGGGGASLPTPASVSIAAPARAHAAFRNVAKRRILVFSHDSTGGPDREPRPGLRGDSRVQKIYTHQPTGRRSGRGRTSTTQQQRHERKTT